VTTREGDWGWRGHGKRNYDATWPLSTNDAAESGYMASVVTGPTKRAFATADECSSRDRGERRAGITRTRSSFRMTARQRPEKEGRRRRARAHPDRAAREETNRALDNGARKAQPKAALDMGRRSPCDASREEERQPAARRRARHPPQDDTKRRAATQDRTTLECEEAAMADARALRMPNRQATTRSRAPPPRRLRCQNGPAPWPSNEHEPIAVAAPMREVKGRRPASAVSGAGPSAARRRRSTFASTVRGRCRARRAVSW